MRLDQRRMLDAIEWGQVRRVPVFPSHVPEGASCRPRRTSAKEAIEAHCLPTMIIQAGNDPTDDVRHSLTYSLALQCAKVPVALHLYVEGGHAFGSRRSSNAVTEWPSLVERWLRTINVLSPSRS